jgi:D-alanyl-D-alanine carboxypeptidase
VPQQVTVAWPALSLCDVADDGGVVVGNAMRSAGSLTRRRLIGGAAAAGLGAAVLDPAVAWAGLVAGGQDAGHGGAFRPATARILQQIIASGAGAANAPGLNIGVWVPGRGRYVQALGVSDVVTRAPLKLDDHLRIGSITKTFTATAILQLVDENKISLNDRLGRYITGIPYGGQITIAQMLGMTSGIYDFVNDAEFIKAYVDNPLLPFSLRNVVTIINRNKPLFPPGTSIAYDNSGYYLLGAIAEKVSGLPLPQLIAEKITRPLGMRETSYPTTPALPAPFSRGYLVQAASFSDATASNPAVPAGAGAMISTLADLKVWAKALATGTLLKPATQARRLKTKVLVKDPQLTARYGLGIASFNGFLGHDGSVFGYGSTILYLPSADATIIGLSNTAVLVGNPPPLLITLALAAHLFPGHFPNGI